MGRHGWNGQPPADEAEARERILVAGRRCIDQRGVERTSLSDVAVELGVTRQTVYRYFPSTEDLFAAVADVAVARLFDELDELLEHSDDPVEAVIEATAHVIERLPHEPYLAVLLVRERTEQFTRGMTSQAAITSGSAILRRSRIDWDAHGYTDSDMRELVEVVERMIQSMIISPPRPPREGAELRMFLRRWLGPSIAAARSGAVSS